MSSTPDTDIRSLREKYHSLHETDRSEVIRRLGGMRGDADAARELIQLHEDCQWRSTRMEIVRALGCNAHQRALEFLFQLALQPDDVSIAEAAIWALGQTHQSIAGRFLTAFYAKCPPTLKAAVVGAVGQIPDRRLAPQLLEALKSPAAKEDPKLAKNLVLTLGELKVAEAAPLLEAFVLDKEARPALALGALVSIGKISRDPKFLDSAEALFRPDLWEDPLEYQVFTNARVQVQIRAQWRLEDYLGRFFESASPHRSLPLELNSFAAADVREGLKMFSGDPKHFDRLCDALARVDFAGVTELYSELFSRISDPDRAARVLESIAHHHHEGFAPLLKILQPLAFTDPTHPAYARWFEAVAMALPQAPAVFKDVLESAQFAALPESARIAAVNQVVNCALTLQPVPAQAQALGQLLGKLGANDPSPAVQGRVLRALGRLRWEDKKTLEAARAHLAEPALTASCLAYLEACPSKAATTAIVEFAQKKDAAAPFATRVLHALTCQESVPADAVASFVSQCLEPSKPAEVRLEALRFLQKHPAPAHLDQVKAALKSEERLQIQAVIALREFRDESSTDLLSPLLASTNRSLAGRALDTLTALPGLRAKRLIIDFLKDHPEDEEVCDKVVRCLETPEKPVPYFTEAIDAILSDHPNHPQWEGLVSLRDRLRAPVAGAALEPGASAMPGPALAEVESEIHKHMPAYADLDDSVKTALRSAELPYLRPELFDGSVDKASSVLEYCKAVDLLLEKNLGRKILFPKIERGLHEFQNILHHVGLGEEYADPTRLLDRCGLKGVFTVENLPAHKMRLMAVPFLNARILNDRFKVLDGLRAWAVILLLFARKLPGQDGRGLKPPITVQGLDDSQVAHLCRRLAALQEVRNPAAHRQTFLTIAGIDDVRSEVYQLLNMIQKSF